MTSAKPASWAAATPAPLVDDDGPLRTHTESAGGFDQDCGRHAIDTDTEKLFNPSGFQELLTARAQRIDRRGDPDVKQLAHQVDRRLEQEHHQCR